MKGGTYNQLLVFQAIAREGSVRAAARKLEMTPPSVSHSLKLLEKTIGLPLFNRTTRRIELTEAGQLLLERTSDAISTLDFALESVQDLSKIPAGKVSITLPRFAFQFLLRPIYAEFCQRYPTIELEVSVSDAAVNIISEGFDMGIRFGDRVEEGMVARQLTPPMREALFASPSYLAQYGTPIEPEDLQQHKLIQYRFITSKQQAPLLLHHSGETITVDMPNAMIVNDTDLMVDAAQSGIGIGRLVDPMLRTEFENKTLIPVLEPYWQPYPGLYVYFMQNSQKARRIRVLIDFLVEKAALYQAPSGN